MKNILLFTTLFFLSSTVFSQGVYETKIYDDINEQSNAYREVLFEKEELQEKCVFLVETLKNQLEEKEEMEIFFFALSGGHLFVLEREFRDPFIIEVLKRNNVERDSILNLTKRLAIVQSRKRSFDKLIQLKNSSDISYPYISLDKRKELKKYEIENGDKILHIDISDTSYGKYLGQEAENVEMYFYAKHEQVLNTMYYFYKWDNAIVETKERQANKYYVVRGGDATTGIENSQFDKIIIRNYFHHFEEKEKLLESIKKSMTKESLLIITTGFRKKLEIDEQECCHVFMMKEDFENLLIKNKFIRVSSQKMKTKDKKKYWIYKYKKEE